MYYYRLQINWAFFKKKITKLPRFWNIAVFPVTKSKFPPLLPFSPSLGSEYEKWVQLLAALLIHSSGPLYCCSLEHARQVPVSCPQLDHFQACKDFIVRLYSSLWFTLSPSSWLSFPASLTVLPVLRTEATCSSEALVNNNETRQHHPRNLFITNSVPLVRERTIPSDSHLSAKLVPTFADRGVSHGQCGGSPTAVISVF
jgi:hypothetical protein